MKKLKYFGIVLLCGLVCMAFFLDSVAAGTVKESVNKTFSPQLEAKIRNLESLPPQEVIKELEKSDYMLNKNLTYKAVHTAFKHRKRSAIHMAKDYVTVPLIEVVEGRRLYRVREFNIARKIFETFPDEALPELAALYRDGDGITRGNIIRVYGGMENEPATRDMLIEALDDTSPAEEEDLEQLGEPLRVCDVAYNQLVLKLHVRNVLRTLSPGHKIKIRDHHIGILKSRLLSGTYN